MIFVFGSNEAGIHGAGAAKTAYEQHGAILLNGSGRMGDSFAIPTKGKKLDGRKVKVGDTLPLNRIRMYIDGFIRYAKNHPELEFQVTQIGCGYAGIPASDIAPMFNSAPDNCLFDEAWKPILGDDKRYWGTYVAPAAAPITSDADDSADILDAIQDQMNSPNSDAN